MIFESFESADIQMDEIASVRIVGGAAVFVLKDGTTKMVADGDGVLERELQGVIDVSAMVSSGYVSGAGQGSEGTALEKNQAEKTAAQEQGGKQPAGLGGASQDQALMDQLAEELAAVETASGDDGAGGGSNGYGFNSNFASQSVEGIDDVGALGETELQYVLGEFKDESCVETAPVEPTLTLLDPETGRPLEGSYEVLEDGTVQLLLRAEPDLNNSFMQITIKGIPSTWTVTGDGAYNPATQTWTFTTTQPGQTFIGGPIVKPPADSDVDLTGLVFTVVERNPATGQTGTASTTIDVIVDAVADPAEISAQDTTGLEDTAVPVTFSGAPGDKDGSEVIVKYVVQGVPEGFTLSAGTNLGHGSWELTPDQAAGLKLNPPKDFHGSVPLTVTIHTAETVTDKEFDLTNNTATATDDLCVTFLPVADPPRVDVDLPKGSECGCQGKDGLVAKVYEDNSIDVAFSATRDAGASPTEYLTVSVSGVDLTKLEAGSFTISGAGGAIWTRVSGTPDSAATFTIKLPADMDYAGTMRFKPKADSDIDLSNIKVSATAHEPASETSSESNIEAFDVIVDAVADKPAITAHDVAMDEEGVPAALNIQAGVTDRDGSESITHYEIRGVPQGFSFNSGTSKGNGVWSFTPAEIVGLKITPPASYEGKITLEVHVFNLDDPSDKDFDTANNTNTNRDTFTVEWQDDEPVVCNGYGRVDETGGFDSVSGTLAIDYGQDGAGKVEGNGGFQSSYALKSGGVPVAVTYENGVYTGKAGAIVVFKLTIGAGGSYAFQQLHQLDHADGSDPNDVLRLEFGVKATDGDGDSTNGKIVIDVLDDGPVAVNDNLPTFTSYAGLPAKKLDVLANDRMSSDQKTVIIDASFRSGQTFTVAKYKTYVTENPAYEGPTHTTPKLSLAEFEAKIAEFAANGGKLEALVSLASGAYALINYGTHLELFTVATKWHVGSDVQIAYTIQDGDGDISCAVACTPIYHSPLVLDLDGDGVELLGAEAGVMFDMDNDGQGDRTGWVGPDDGLLALDINGDGIINNQGELFGNAAAFADGFANLAQYDDNGDGIIDAADAIFAQLVVWQDANSDGISQAGEMFRLGDLDIASLSLAAANANYQLNGNVVTAESHFTYEDGTRGSLVDAWFEVASAAEGEGESGTDETGGFAFEAGSAGEELSGFEDEIGTYDITDLLDGSDPVQEAIDAFVFATEDRAGAVPSGGGGQTPTYAGSGGVTPLDEAYQVAA